MCLGGPEVLRWSLRGKYWITKFTADILTSHGKLKKMFSPFRLLSCHSAGCNISRWGKLCWWVLLLGDFERIHLEPTNQTTLLQSHPPIELITCFNNHLPDNTLLGSMLDLTMDFSATSSFAPLLDPNYAIKGTKRSVVRNTCPTIRRNNSMSKKSCTTLIKHWKIL